MADEIKNPPVAPPQDPDIEERLAGFNAGLKQLLGKYELGLVAQPFIENGLIVGRCTVVSVRKRPDAPAPEAPKAETPAPSKLSEA